MKPKVYLAGPIRGLNYNEATEWREKTIKDLDDVGIDGMSPMRAKEYLRPLAEVGFETLKDAYAEHPLSTVKAIMCRDYKDCTQSDAVIMHLKGAKQISIGSIMEIAWAYATRVPIILIMEKDGSNVNQHGMIMEAINFHVETLEEAVFIAKALLLK